MGLISALDSLLDQEGDKRFDEVVLGRMVEACSPFIPDNVRKEVLNDLKNLRRPSLRSRLRKHVVSNPTSFPLMNSNKKRRDFVLNAVIAERACVAHANADDCQEAAKGPGRYVLGQLIRMLINVRLMQLLGFPEDDIRERFQSASEFGTEDLLRTVSIA